ncbi:hypothetical protein REC12_14895 [Desulfosporosinus sp. PR]|uniref:hypothetical protein n=1 Tax=Candidatus Desulfosporosinus nitrosoreducens TaxID=3401928 RepID=UPI0027F2E4E9|nr:hypothetical protein [Desulfosporosinus sp. PR]MDQ7094883.1 hypothetical protein [Desulfosporosinus sp. PR]
MGSDTEVQMRVTPKPKSRRRVGVSIAIGKAVKREGFTVDFDGLQRMAGHNIRVVIHPYSIVVVRIDRLSVYIGKEINILPRAAHIRHVGADSAVAGQRDIRRDIKLIGCWRRRNCSRKKRDQQYKGKQNRHQFEKRFGFHSVHSIFSFKQVTS